MRDTRREAYKDHEGGDETMADKATITAVTNQKGGVGKTVTCENLGISHASVAKRYGNGLLTRISQVRVLSGGYARFV